MSWPAKTMLPPHGGTSPDRARASVLLPAPLAPSTASARPAPTVKEMPARAVASPYRTRRSTTVRMAAEAEAEDAEASGPDLEDAGDADVSPTMRSSESAGSISE